MILQHTILRTASWLVPTPLRADWLAEWLAELCYVTWRPTRFCLGAFRDALWLRRNTRIPGARRTYGLESPGLCLLLLALLAVGSAALAFRLPFGREMLLPSPYADPQRLAVFKITVERYRWLAAHQPYAFTALAVYRPGRIATASRNLPVVLGTLPGAGHLPANPQSWRMEDADWFDRLPPWTKVFVVGRLRQPVRGRFRMPVFDEREGSVQLQCDSLAPENPIWAYCIMAIASLLTLATTNHLRLGEYPSNRHPARRWSFLAVKAALVLAIIGCGSLDLAALTSPGMYPTAWLVGLVLGLRWVVVDQRRRCPECLRLLSNPTRIGGASQIFLEWYGTELICARGHGLLYVPEIATSCYSVQRWQNLDPSWSGLFHAG